MQKLLTVIAKGLVDDPDSVSVEADAPAEDGTVVYHIHVAENDMGRIIGKQGRIAKAIRTIARSAAIRYEEKILVEID
ncbi:MAG: KH domain-containing protein [Ruminococcus sp.]|nr:KH domain-containing protein [Ruminococcus sp.]